MIQLLTRGNPGLLEAAIAFGMATVKTNESVKPEEIYWEYPDGTRKLMMFGVDSAGNQRTEELKIGDWPWKDRNPLD